MEVVSIHQFSTIRGRSVEYAICCPAVGLVDILCVVDPVKQDSSPSPHELRQLISGFLLVALTS
jgi:hypothetical protein